MKQFSVQCLVDSYFSFFIWIVCPLIYGFWLFLWYLQTFRLTAFKHHDFSVFLFCVSWLSYFGNELWVAHILPYSSKWKRYKLNFMLYITWVLSYILSQRKTSKRIRIYFEKNMTTFGLFDLFSSLCRHFWSNWKTFAESIPGVYYI
jgi:hypothetical protein